MLPSFSTAYSALNLAASRRTSGSMRISRAQVPLLKYTPLPLRRLVPHHQVQTAYERGWSQLRNGELLDAAEREGFDLLVTTDMNLRYQQNLASRRIGIVVLRTTSWPRIEAAAAAVVSAIDGLTAGGYVEVVVP